MWLLARKRIFPALKAAKENRSFSREMLRSNWTYLQNSESHCALQVAESTATQCNLQIPLAFLTVFESHGLAYVG
jgi:hypothetical protein